MTKFNVRGETVGRPVGELAKSESSQEEVSAVGKPTREEVVATLLILVKQDETLEPHLYLDTNQQKEMHLEIKRVE